jgi:FtsZ-interacting cell division protein YlmF
MGLIEGFKKMINPEANEEDDYNYDENQNYEDDQGYNTGYNESFQQGDTGLYNQPQQNAPQRGVTNQYGANGNNNAYPQPVNNSGVKIGGTGSGSGDLELKVLRPERFDSVRQISDHLLNKRTVILNLEGATKEDTRRIIDFLSGVVYSINGDLRRVANNTVVVTPNNVDVSMEQQVNQHINKDFYSNK